MIHALCGVVDLRNEIYCDVSIHDVKIQTNGQTIHTEKSNSEQSDIKIQKR